ncbi:uncharacterized protein [Antedon mediterranea]|uniref:uncharacterized protein n=1 Tax=Antedon mediterranea TaxID=105859 RepID=UPI003AF4232F
MAVIIGKVEEFDSSLEAWDSYTERLDQYFVANKVDDDRKVPALLALIGPKTYTLLKNLCSPEKPATLSYADLITKLTTHLCPKPSEIAERFRFYKREQHSGESIASYIAELRRLAIHCNFGNTLTSTLRDIFVCGLRQENIQKRLLAVHDLKLDDAIKTAVAMETASRDATEFQKTRTLL